MIPTYASLISIGQHKLNSYAVYIGTWVLVRFRLLLEHPYSKRMLLLQSLSVRGCNVAVNTCQGAVQQVAVHFSETKALESNKDPEGAAQRLLHNS